MQLITTTQLDAIKPLINQINEQYSSDPCIKKISLDTYEDEDCDGNTMLCAQIYIDSWPTRSAADEAATMAEVNKIEKSIISAGYPCQITLNTSDNSHSASYVVSDDITAHTNQNGVLYYSRPDDEHGTVYSFRVDFEDIWTQDDQELYGA